MNIQAKTTWDLSTDFYTGLQDGNLNQDLQTGIELVNQFVVDYKGKIASLDAQELLEFFKKDNQIDQYISKVGLYLFYISSLDTQNQDFIRKNGEFETLMAETGNKLLFISQEFKELGYDRLIELSNEPDLQEYRNYFLRKAQSIHHLLDEKTEFAINLKDNAGVQAINNLYDELVGSFLFKIELNGEVQTATEDEIRNYRTSPDEETRKKAYQSMREVYNHKQHQITLGGIYRSIVKDWVNESKLRGFPGVMSPRNLSEQMPDEVVDIMLTGVSNQFRLYQRYLKVKAKLMKKDSLMIWDVYAPLSSDERDYPFDKGLEILNRVLTDFDSEFADFTKDTFENGRVDVNSYPGKRGGAFCSYEKGFPSFVLLNYTGKLHDVSTMAHELGHAIHGYFSQAQPTQSYHSGLCLAETASVFNEMLVNEALLKELTPQEKLHFTEMRLQDIFATIFRQVQYVNFEKKVHESVLNGKELTYTDFNRMWREEQLKLTGSEITYDVEAEQECFWSGIPHLFRTPFYCYSYAFGNLLTFGLYEQYLEQGADFIPRYKNILRAGGSVPPQELLLSNGFDITSPEYYRKGLKVVEKMVEEFEELAKRENHSTEVA